MGDETWTTADIGDQTGRIAVVTGANSGLGLATATALGKAGATVILAVRNLAAGQAATESITQANHLDPERIVLQELDLSSLKSVQAAALELSESQPHIDLLINNAGVMYTPKATTAEGFELQFGVNHLGHFALTGLLLGHLSDTSRVVSVSSVGHRIMSSIDFDDLRAENRYNRVAAYGRSKLSNLLFTYALQRRLDAAGAAPLAMAAHPGVAATELTQHLPSLIHGMAPLAAPLLQSPEKGSLPTLRAATDPAATGGQYYGPDGIGELRGDPIVVGSSDRSHDLELQDKLWDVSEELTGVEFNFD